MHENRSLKEFKIISRYCKSIFRLQMFNESFKEKALTSGLENRLKISLPCQADACHRRINHSCTLHRLHGGSARRGKKQAQVSCLLPNNGYISGGLPLVYALDHRTHVSCLISLRTPVPSSSFPFGLQVWFLDEPDPHVHSCSLSHLLSDRSRYSVRLSTTITIIACVRIRSSSNPESCRALKR